jgi:CHASE2 domain-containing sensor protein
VVNFRRVFPVLQGFTNILAWQMKQKFGYLLAMIANLISLLLVIALVFLMGEIQAYIGTLLALLALVGSFYYWRNQKRINS